MNTHHLLHRHREGIEGIVVAQILFGGAREFGQVAQFMEVVRVHACGVEFTTIHWHIVIRMIQRPLQTLGLQGLQLITRGGFNRI